MLAWIQQARQSYIAREDVHGANQRDGRAPATPRRSLNDGPGRAHATGLCFAVRRRRRAAGGGRRARPRAARSSRAPDKAPRIRAWTPSGYGPVPPSRGGPGTGLRCLQTMHGGTRAGSVVGTWGDCSPGMRPCTVHTAYWRTGRYGAEATRVGTVLRRRRCGGLAMRYRNDRAADLHPERGRGDSLRGRG